MSKKGHKWQERRLMWFLRTLLDCAEATLDHRTGERGVTLLEWMNACDLSDEEFQRLYDEAWNNNFISHSQYFNRYWGVEVQTGEHYGITRDGARFLGFIEREETERGYQKEPIPAELRWAVWERDDFTCQACGVRRHLSVDHIIPESKGGPMTLDNLRTLCRTCNSRKGAR